MDAAQQYEKFLRMCIDAAASGVAEGDYPLAAAVIRNNDVLALRRSTLAHGTDPTAHPEVEAIRDAATRERSRYLQDAVLVSTLEPCPMCVAAAIWAKMKGIVFGATQNDALDWVARRSVNDPVITWRQIKIPAAYVAERGDPTVWVAGGVLRDDCVALFSLVPSSG